MQFSFCRLCLRHKGVCSIPFEYRQTICMQDDDRIRVQFYYLKGTLRVKVYEKCSVVRIEFDRVAYWLCFLRDDVCGTSLLGRLQQQRWLNSCPFLLQGLTHCGQVTHICVGKLTNNGSDKGLSPGRRQSIIWTNAGILLIGPLCEQTSVKFQSELKHFHSRKCTWNCRLRNGVHFLLASKC